MARIVLCEDDPSIQKLVQAALRPTGHEVLVAGDGVEGLRLIDESRPDLVLTDLAMPRLGGLDLVDALKARPGLAAIPVVLVTASVQRAQLDEAYRHGIDGHLEKPFSARDLVDIVRRFVGGVARSTIAG
ncbi:MAG: response regulator [Thermomicrobiales bacterium]